MRLDEIFIPVMEAIPLSLAKTVSRMKTNTTDEFFSFYNDRKVDRRGYRLSFPFEPTAVSGFGPELVIMNKVFGFINNFIDDGIAYFLEPNQPWHPVSDRAYLKLEEMKPNAVVDGYINGMLVDRATFEPLRNGKIGRLLENIKTVLGKLKFRPQHADLQHTLIKQATTLLKDFANDPIRQANFRRGDYMIIISRHPVDVAGASTGRGWTSCTDLIDGQHRDRHM